MSICNIRSTWGTCAGERPLRPGPLAVSPDAAPAGVQLPPALPCGLAHAYCCVHIRAEVCRHTFSFMLHKTAPFSCFTLRALHCLPTVRSVEQDFGRFVFIIPSLAVHFYTLGAFVLLSLSLYEPILERSCFTLLGLHCLLTARSLEQGLRRFVSTLFLLYFYTLRCVCIVISVSV